MLWIIVAVTGILVLAVINEAWLGYPPPKFHARTLSRKEQAFLRASAAAMFPSGGSLPSGEDAGIVAYFDNMMDEVPKRQRLLMRLLFIFLEHGALVFGPVHKRVTRMSVDECVLVFRAWENSNFYFRRISFLSLRTLMTMAYFGADSVSDALLPAHS